MSQIIKTVVKLKLHMDRVARHVAAKKKRVLFKTGGFTLIRMQRLMRYRKGPSKRGQPPSAHKSGAGPLLRKVSGFQVNLQTENVVIGPKKFRELSHPSGKPVPQLLNEGGPVNAELKGRRVVAEVAPRPFVPGAFVLGNKEFRRLLEKEDL